MSSFFNKPLALGASWCDALCVRVTTQVKVGFICVSVLGCRTSAAKPLRNIQKLIGILVSLVLVFVIS